MNYNSNNLTGLLTEWGHSQQQPPQNNSVLKSEALNHLARNLKPVAGNFKFQWLPLAFSGLAALALIIQLAKPNAVSQHSSLSFSSPISNSVPASSQGLNEQAAGQTSGLSQSDSYLQNLSPSAAKNSEEPSNQNLDYKARGTYQAPPQPLAEVPAADNRELLKTDYSAYIQTHNVMDLASRVQTTIHAFDGRIDSNSSSKDSAYISFVMPATKLDAFKLEIKNLARERFVTESIQSQNMLPQKIDIESQQKSLQQQLDDTATQKQQLTETHTRTVNSLQSQLRAISLKLNDLQNQTPDNLDQQYQIEQQKQQLTAQLKALLTKLENENNNYQSQSSSLDYQSQSLKNNLDNVKTQNNNLDNSVATVRGTISFAYISRWEIWNSYLGGGGWLAIILGLLALISYFATRLNKLIIP